MERIRRFQRTLITGLTGINSFVFCLSSDVGAGRSLVYSFGSMLIMLTLIMGYIMIRKNVRAKAARAARTQER